MVEKVAKALDHQRPDGRIATSQVRGSQCHRRTNGALVEWRSHSAGMASDQIPLPALFVGISLPDLGKVTDSRMRAIDRPIVAQRPVEQILAHLHARESLAR